MAIVLTQRDIDILRFIASRRSALSSIVAERYFSQDPYDEIDNVDPMKACARRLGALARAGYVRLRFDFDGREKRRVVTLGPASEPVVGVSCNARRVPARNRAHHIRTQEAIGHLERLACVLGSRIVDVRFEQDVRARDLATGKTVKGQRFSAAPDAVIQVEMRGRGEAVRVEELAVEYVTSKYTDADILAKHESFGRFDDAHWFADSARTAERVRRLTGVPCTAI